VAFSCWWVFVAAPPAAAHETDPHIVTVLDRVRPPLPTGVVVEVRAAVAEEVLVSNTTRRELAVLAASGQPFLRIGPRGVLADVHAPDWYSSNSPLGAVRLPPGARAGARPRWVRVRRAPAWGWFDHRLHAAALVPSERVRAARVVTTLARWRIPVRYAGRAHAIEGHTEYRPFLGRFLTGLDASSVPAGVDADVLQGRVPGLSLHVAAGRTLVLPGFAVVTSAGARINGRSERYVEDRRLRGEPLPRRGAVLLRGPRFTWLDPRLRYPSNAPPPRALARTSGPTVVTRWRVPIVVDGVRHALTGSVTWQPEGGALTAATTGHRHRPSPWPGLTALLAVVVASGLVLSSAHREAG
jgi:hypothetical protein